MPVVLAHAGHILIDLPIFAGPVFVIGGWLALTVRRDRRGQTERARRASESGGDRVDEPRAGMRGAANRARTHPPRPGGSISRAFRG